MFRTFDALRRLGPTIATGLLLITVAQCARALDLSLKPAHDIDLESAGARFGFPANDTAKELLQAEAFSNLNLPWRWNFFGGTELDSRLDFSVGWLGGRGDNAVIATLGPSLKLRFPHYPVSFDFGSSPTLLTRHNWGPANLGGDFQFSTHVGADWDFASHCRLGYRFVHMSNAGLEHPNPGINLHEVSLSFLF